MPDSAPAPQADEALDRFVTARMAAAGTPGMALALVERAGRPRIAVYGFADPESRAPVAPETLFAVGSLTKSFTAVATVRAVERGLLDLDRPVTDYLPWFRVRSRYAPITLHHLLTHTAGLVVVVDRSPDMRGAVWALRETPAAWAPGRRFWYSDAGYQTLALVLEAVTDRPFADVLRAEVFTPLGMTGSVGALTAAVRPRLARGYVSLYDDRPAHRSHPRVPAAWIEVSAGDCSVAATAADMAAYARMWLDGGRGPQEPLVTPAGFARLIRPHVVSGGAGGDPDAVSHYGYGVVLRRREGRPHLEHGGGIPGYVAHMNLDADSGVGVVTLSTTPHVSGISWEVLRWWRATRLGEPEAGAALRPAPDPLSVPDAGAFAGHYRAADGGAAGALQELRLTAEAAPAGPRLVLHHAGQRLPLEPRGPDRFYAGHPDLDRFLLGFQRAAAAPGTPGRDRQEAPPPVVSALHGAQRFVRMPCATPEAGTSGHPPAWAAYPGHYRAHNPWQTNFRVVLRGDDLLLVQPGGDETRLVPCPGTENAFRVGDAPTPERIHFDQVAAGQALRATLSACAYYRFFTP